MANKTPMQEAIEQITQLSDNENITGFTKRAYAICLDILTELLEKENQVNECFFLAGREPKDKYPFTEDKYERFEDYYNEKFNNNEA